MDEHDSTESRGETSDPLQRALSPDVPVRVTSPGDLRDFPLPQQRVGGYARDVVDDLLGRAAQTVESLLEEVNASHEQIARLESAQAALEDRLQSAARRSPEEIVGEVLLTAQQAAEAILEKANQDAAAVAGAAHRDITTILADARATLERTSHLHQDAQAAVEQARVQADAILDSARAEREQLIAEAVSAADRRREELEASNLRLETAIKGLRNEWASRAAEALARLEGIGLERPAVEDARLEPGPSTQADGLEAASDAGEAAAAPVELAATSEAPGSSETGGEPEAAPSGYDLDTRRWESGWESSEPDSSF